MGQTDATGSAVFVIIYEMGVNKRTSDSLNVYTVELYAILLAFEWIEQTRDNILICRIKRKEQVMICRLRTGHCKLNKTLRTIGKHPTFLHSYAMNVRRRRQLNTSLCRAGDIHKKGKR